MKRLLLISILWIVTVTLCIAQTSIDKRDINQKYIDANTNGIKIFRDNELLKENIIKELKKKAHTYRTVFDDSTYSRRSEDCSQISELSKYQTEIIYLMLTNLKDTAFLNQMGEIIRADVADVYSEFGGVIKFTKSGKIYLKCLESAEYFHNEEYNDTYFPPKETDSLRKIADFHLHATSYSETPYAGPASLDLMHAYVLNNKNMTNEFVITSLKKGEFNIDYYGQDIRAGENGLLYEGDDVKVIDLGNYYYKVPQH